MKSELFLLLPDIRSGFNVGSFFRTADGLGVAKIFLTGFSPYPPHKEITKTALGAEKFVHWQYYLKPIDIIQKLKTQKTEIICLENTSQSENIENYIPKNKKVCLVCGNEIEGINKEILDLADKIVSIKMAGVKKSYNVAIAGSIALFEISKKL